MTKGSTRKHSLERKAARRDYYRVARAIEYLDQQRHKRPSLQATAEYVGLSPHHFQRMFRRWCGVTPKQFLSYLTVEDAKPLLDEAWPLIEVSDALGLSGPSRLHDVFLSVEALTPGQYKRRGAGMTIHHGVYVSPFGTVLALRNDKGLCGLEFIDDDGALALERAQLRWAGADFVIDGAEGELLVDAAFLMPFNNSPLPVHLSGTNFQVRVWAALMQVPWGATVGYGALARAMGAPRAARAVGAALGANPVGWLIPCHRVIRAVGGVGGYRWGEQRKRLMLAWEKARKAGYAA